jgi:glutamine amidotransferase
MKVAVVDYGSGNLASAARALMLAADRDGIPASVTITANPSEVAAADRIVLPGQGAFADCARGLAAIPGLSQAIVAATDDGTPFLGICVGMQLMAQRGLEHETTDGFGWIAGEIAAMTPPPQLRLPQIGMVAGVEPGDHAYFVHSYALQGGQPAESIASTDYGGPVVAMVATGNRAGTQFHVEKSQEVGLRILGNFLRWTP